MACYTVAYRVIVVIDGAVYPALFVVVDGDEAPRREGAVPLLGPVIPDRGTEQMGGNQIAQLAQERELPPRWVAGFSFCMASL